LGLGFIAVLSHHGRQADPVRKLFKVEYRTNTFLDVAARIVKRNPNMELVLCQPLEWKQIWKFAIGTIVAAPFCNV
jgi:hypothetical protein